MAQNPASGSSRLGTIIPFVLIAGILLAMWMFSDTTCTLRRNAYAHVDTCGEDYSPALCRAVADAEGIGAVGPWFWHDRANLPPNDPGPGRSAAYGRSQLAVRLDYGKGGFGDIGGTGDVSSCS